MKDFNKRRLATGGAVIALTLLGVAAFRFFGPAAAEAIADIPEKTSDVISRVEKELQLNNF